MSSSAVSFLSSLFDGLGGISQGSFFRPPPHVDLEKPPGTTSLLRDDKTLREHLWGYVTLSFFFYSPNLVWFVMTALQWVALPYDLTPDPSRSDIWRQFVNRLVINVIINHGYYGFWHCALYVWHWSSRPFVQNRKYNISNVVHNIFYSTLGVIQWTLTEIAFLYAFRTGRLLYASNASLLNIDDPRAMLGLVAGILLTPLFREAHFYFGHRFLHIKFLYKYIHAVHHRNVDIEPFSGLSMHPIEHLYYYASYALLIWGQPACFAHPFLVLWMGNHLIWAPAASHSGYEDHWQSELYHYLHHRYFDCNYGSPGLPLERWMGTSFCDRLKTIQSSQDNSNNDTSIYNAKATLWGPPEDLNYWFLGVFLPAAWLYAALTGASYPLLNDNPRAVAAIIASMPVLAAALLHAVSYFTSKTKTTLWKHFVAPFHESSTVSLLVHSALGGAVCSILPVYQLIALLLLEPPQQH